MRKLLIALGVLVVLFIAADRISAAVAENRISDRIAASYGLSARPGVSIQGFPFLTQVLTGDYNQINVSVTQVGAGGITLHDLRARFTGIHASLTQVLGNGAGTVTADRATGTAIVSYRQVDQRLPAGLRVRPHGKGLMVSGTVKAGALRVPISATVQLGITGGGVKVTPMHVTVMGGIGLPVAADASRFGVVLPVTALPLHLHLTSVHVSAGGLRIGAAARHVHFARS
jgi:hypothetical protein